jgi:hypothetical protein
LEPHVYLLKVISCLLLPVVFVLVRFIDLIFVITLVVFVIYLFIFQRFGGGFLISLDGAVV